MERAFLRLNSRRLVARIWIPEGGTVFGEGRRRSDGGLQTRVDLDAERCQLTYVVSPAKRLRIHDEESLEGLLGGLLAVVQRVLK